MTTTDLKQADYEALADFRYQIRRFVRFSEQAARKAGIEPQQHQLMLALKGAGGRNGCRIGELAEKLQIQHHSAVELASRLEEKQFIHRSRGDEDRREVYVRLTAQGEHVLSELTLHHRDELRSAGPVLVAALRRAMGRRHSTVRKQARRVPLAGRTER